MVLRITAITITHDTTRSIYLFNSRSIDFKCVCVFGRLLLSRKRWLFSSHKHFLRRAFANKIYRNRFFRFCTAFFDFSFGLQKQKKAVRTWTNQYFSQLLFIRSIAESISKVTWRNICFWERYWGFSSITCCCFPCHGKQSNQKGWGPCKICRSLAITLTS